MLRVIGWGLVGVAVLTAWMGGAAPLLAQTPPPAAQGPAPPSTPASPDLMRFLSTTPITLLDWGMLRLERDLEEAVKQLGLDRGREGPPKIGTQFRFGDRRVIAYASFAVKAVSRTEANCRDIFTTVREGLLSAAPKGATGAGWYLARTFNSDFRRLDSQPEPFDDLMLDAVLLEITLRVPQSEAFAGGPGRVACAGRLDAETAYIVPLPQVPTQPRPAG